MFLSYRTVATNSFKNCGVLAIKISASIDWCPIDDSICGKIMFLSADLMKRVLKALFSVFVNWLI